MPSKLLPLALALAALCALMASRPVAALPPSDFEDELLILGLAQPISLAFLPDGRMLILQKQGEILIANANDVPVSATPYLNVPDVESTGERGLMGVVLDPQFASNGFLYLYYTHAITARHRIARFTHTGDSADPASEFVVWQDAQEWEGIGHIGGGLDIGPDGMLYLGTGDENDGSQAQDITQSGGKIIRVATDGTVPSDNPFVGVVGAEESIWALGLRNPLRARWDLPTGRLFVGDVGQDTFEEVHLATRGANLGWPNCDGACTIPGYDNPLFQYSHESVGGSVIGGFVYRGSAFPSPWAGAYFFGDFAQGWIRYLTFDASDNLSGDFDFDPGAGNLVFLDEGNDGALYYIRFSLTGGQSEIRRIRYAPGNRAPTIDSATADQTTGPGPSLTVSFSGTATDPEGDPVSYHWIFGDGAEAFTANATHTFQNRGVYSVTLHVSDAGGTRSSDPISIVVGQPPVLTIESPADGTSFRGGEEIPLIATWSDPDGPLSEADLSWEIALIHDEHRHPGALIEGLGTTSFTTPTTDHDFHDETAFEITLLATDADGLTARVAHVITPEKVDLVLDTDPPGLAVVRDGFVRTAPTDYTTLIYFEHTVEAPSPQCLQGTEYVFDSWSDGGARTHTVTVPASSQTWTASYLDNGPCDRITDSQIALYAFDEGSGATVSDSAAVAPALDLTIADPGAVTWLPGGGLSVDAITTIASAGAADKIISAIQASEEMTVEAWLRPSSPWLFGPARIVAVAEGPLTGADFLLGQGPSPSQTQSYSARLRSSTTNAFGVPALDTPAGSLSTDRTYVVYTRDAAGNAAFYLDGALAASTQAPGSLAGWTPMPLALANEPTGDRGWTGELYLVAFHDRALSASEVARAVRASTPDNRPPLAATETYQVLAGETLVVSQEAGVLANDSDPDGDTVVALLHSDVSSGVLELNLDGSFSYVHDGGPGTIDGFTYSADDGLIGTPVSVSIEIAPQIPTFQLQPHDRAVAPGESAVFRCSATSSLPIVWTWERDGVPIPGANSPVYVTPPALPGDAGARFRCIPANTSGSAPSAEAVLDVIASERALSGLLVLYTFLEAAGDLVYDVSGFEPALDLRIADTGSVNWLPDGGLDVHTATGLLSESSTAKLADRLVASNEISVEAWIVAANTSQFGPARIVALSQDSSSAGGNLVLGQGSSPSSADDIEARLRTTTTNQFGLPSLKSGAGVVDTVLQHVVYTRGADGDARLYVDGVEVAAGTAGGDLTAWTNYGLTLANDRTLDRAWLGVLRLVAIYDRELEPADVSRNQAAGPPSTSTPQPPTPVPVFGPARRAVFVLFGLGIVIAILWRRRPA